MRNHLNSIANTCLIGSHVEFKSGKKTRIYRARYDSTRRILALKRKHLNRTKSGLDVTDLKTKELLGLKRSHFTQTEDLLIILCHITGLLIDPTYSKNFFVHKREIRDILHDEFSESHDKTSDALLRRAKYLRRQSPNVALINETTAEL